MRALTESIINDIGFGQIAARIEGGGCPIAVSGLDGIHKSHAAAAVRRTVGCPVVVIVADEMEMTRTASDLEALTSEPAVLLAGREFTFYNAEGVSRQLEQRRLRALCRMMQGRAPVVVATIDGLLQRTMAPEAMKSVVLSLKMGLSIDMEDVVKLLLRCGYSRSEQVEGPGQFAQRGGILDFFSPADDEPVRCEFFGDEIDSLSGFDVSTQRRTGNLDTAEILPSAETLAPLYSGGHGTGEEGLKSALKAFLKNLEKRKTANSELKKNITADIERLENRRGFQSADKYMELLYPMATALDYIDSAAVIIINEPGRIAERAKNYLWQQGEDSRTLLEAGVIDASLVRFSLDWEQFCGKIEDFAVVMADSFTSSKYPVRPKALLNISAKQLPSYGGSLETAAGDIAHYANTGYRTVILCQDERRAGILADYLRERGIVPNVDPQLEKLPVNGGCVITVGALSAGMEYPVARLAVITEGQFVEPISLRKKRKALPSNRERVQSFTDLSPGDLVVHEHHGIGRYVGIFKMPVDGIEKDYVKIAYAGTDSLYVPATQLDLVSKYIGGGEDAPIKLSKMGGADWTKAKTRAKGAAKEMARELIALYAERRRLRGHAFAPDAVWQTEFEEKFGYQETDDQMRCIEEIKGDMEQSVPMDRLLCGDVGYGKTEVALRAVMKCILDGYQAAILVPTTVLAQQHYVTAMRRFAGYPVKIEVLSRFRTPQQMKNAVKEIETGAVDLIIGTHRLLQKDVVYKKLGLLIVDEEQRFGVSHKERLKEISRRVDVLTLSATPIPRTLNMALSGIRDMSTIEEPPRDRQPVQTYVLEHDWGIICDAIRREISRGGQVYYIHNRVENIERTASRLSAMLEGVTVAVGHGQMEEDQLGAVMERMAAGEIQVLVCTTIIETGIDIPNVNTLIIEDADKLGLSQLHQIRGRVGRSPRRAFAYLTFRQGKVLTEIAEKRLSAIREFAEFNSGFKIAMRDLEIRGAGNLLGSEQSGHMMSVGYDMYLKLLEEAVLEEKGEKPEKRTDCAADLSVSANIPEKYVPSGEQRMDLYRRIARIRTEEDADDMIAELIDRYGDPPKEAVALVSIALLRGEATAVGISEISQKGGWLRLQLTDFDMNRVSALYSMPEYKGRVKIEAGTVPVIALKLRAPNVIDEATKFVRAYGKAI
ncbi:transcription-repair coupling factor [Sporobacter termitidis DSM 10068]|uniref:Transcription-repair-coupling factor n=1 Tax=Sporobacter termitidis DSM 10068 TaxID=1123282 RepID=A0A1M5VV66_9FIRM|nr:transcription-repair coupling factor [Sporobacter termitidis]SHH79088.1 transcription-repair coupling factor [Sporobacter termitidis DSM 10068]